MLDRIHPADKRAGRPGKPVNVRTVTWAPEEAGGEKWKELFVRILLSIDSQEAGISSDGREAGRDD